MKHSACRASAAALDIIYGATVVACGLVGTIASAGVNEFTPLGPEGGQVTEVEFAGTSIDVVYLAGPLGFYRSTDGGESWQLTKRQRVDDIAVDPVEPDRVYFVDGDKILRSQDGGLTFAATYPANRQGQLTRIECGADGVVYAPDGAKMYRSDDRGQTWRPLGSFPGIVDSTTTFMTRVAVDPADSRVVYVSLYDHGLFVSRDAGTTWQSLSAEPALVHTFDIEVDRSNPLRLWAATNTGIYRSNTGGADWTRIFDSTAYHVEIDSVDSQLLYAVPVGNTVMRTTDGGANWSALPQNFGNSIGATGVALHASIPGRMIAHADGVWLSQDGGTHWLRGNAGYVGSFVNRIVPAIGTSGLHIAAGPSGIHRLDSDRRIRAIDNDRLRAVASPPSTLWVSDLIATRAGATGSQDTLVTIFDSREIARSVDGGTQWTRVTRPAITALPSSLAMSPGAAAILYAGTTEGVFSSADLGDTWTPRNAGLPAHIDVRRLLGTSDPQVLYAAATPLGGTSTDSTLFKTTDGAQSWTVTAAPAGSFPLDAHPNDPQTLYVTHEQDLLRTIDGGATWTRLNADIDRGPYNDVAFEPRDANVLYASMLTRVLRSTDGGSTWERLPSTPNSDTYAIVADPFVEHSVLVGSTRTGLMELSMQPDLKLTMSGPTAMTANTSGTFTLQLSSAGPTSARNVRITAQLPAGATSISASTATGSCSVSAQQVVCTMGDFKADATASITINATTAAVGPFAVQASVAATEADVDTANNSATAQATVNAASTSGSGGGGGGGGGAISMLLLALAGLRVIRPAASKRAVELHVGQGDPKMIEQKLVRR
jgi:uncharacterized repeat protein (TIGR01451 family)